MYLLFVILLEFHVMLEILQKLQEMEIEIKKIVNIMNILRKKFVFHCYELLKYDVFLGHNQDDVVENIFANIIKKKKLR